jgi:hypothetical protein
MQHLSYFTRLGDHPRPESKEITMTKVPEQLTALNKSAIEAALSFAQV